MQIWRTTQSVYRRKKQSRQKKKHAHKRGCSSFLWNTKANTDVQSGTQADFLWTKRMSRKSTKKQTDALTQTKKKKRKPNFWRKFKSTQEARKRPATEEAGGKKNATRRRSWAGGNWKAEEDVADARGRRRGRKQQQQQARSVGREKGGAAPPVAIVQLNSTVKH